MGHLVDRRVINASVTGDGHPQSHVLPVLTENRIVASFHFVGLLSALVHVFGSNVCQNDTTAKRRLGIDFQVLKLHHNNILHKEIDCFWNFSTAIENSLSCCCHHYIIFS